jgi:hypothetical protein
MKELVERGFQAEVVENEFLAVAKLGPVPESSQSIRGSQFNAGPVATICAVGQERQKRQKFFLIRD